MMNYVEFKATKRIPGVAEEGAIFNMLCDIKGLPLDEYWRSRVKDGDFEKVDGKKSRKAKDIKKDIETK